MIIARLRNGRLAASSLALLLAAGGCGSDNGLNMGRVYGRVSYLGEPVEDGQILFAPDESKGTTGVPAMAKIGADGSYTLSTQDPGDGAIVGHHRVGIRGIDPDAVPEAGETSAPVTGKDIFAARGKAASKARKARQTKAAAETITINSKVYRLTTPNRLANPNESGIAVRVSRGNNRIDLAIQEDGSVKVAQ